MTLNIKKNLRKIIVYNKNVKYKYIIEKEFDAGISLLGWEVKAIKNKCIDISNSYVVLKNHEAYLVGANFQKYYNLSVKNKIDRNCKLLLNKKEIILLHKKAIIKGYTIVVMFLYLKFIFIKARIGIAKSKKTLDKRRRILKKEWKRKKQIFI